jgi:hypothetical protein
VCFLARKYVVYSAEFLVGLVDLRKRELKVASTAIACVMSPEFESPQWPQIHDPSGGIEPPAEDQEFYK